MTKHRKGKLQSRARDRPVRNQAAGAGARSAILTYPRVMSRATADIATSEMVYAAVSRIANALATMPCYLYHGSERQKGDPRDVMMSLRPNRRMSAYAFKRAMEINRNVEGRAYAVKRFDATGTLRELVPVDPSRVTPLIDQETGDVWYRIVREDNVEEYLHNWYVIALHHMSTDGVSSVRVSDVLRGTIQYDADVKAFSLSAVKGVNSGIVMEFPNNMGDAARLDAVNDLVRIYRESGGQVLALESGVTAKVLTGNAIDSKAFDVEGVSRTRVATVLNMPLDLLGGAVSSRTTEDRVNELLSLTMQPIVEMWEQELDYKLLTPAERSDDWYYRYDVEAFLRFAASALATLRQSQIRSGSRTVNEIRSRDWLPPVEGGDVALVSKDLAPLAMVAKGATVDLNTINGEHNAAK